MQHKNLILQNEFNSLNPEQKKAALHREGPLLVLAGAGSGKTKVVAIRIACLIHSGIPAHNILGLTFTNKAAQEMKERVLGFIDKNVIVSTFHSLGSKILREAIHYLGYNPQFAIYDEDDVEKLIKSLAKEAFGADVKVDIKSARTAISAMKNALITEGEGEFAALYDLYSKRMKECNAVDFDDLLYLPVTLFRSFPDILSYYQTRWPYVLVDEYQDTNSAQYEFVRLLVQKSHNLFVVGDPDQSIYSWRGANIKNILHFENDYPGATIVRLEQNYRSTKTILQAANVVIQKNQLRYEKSLWSAGAEGEKIQIFQAQHEREEAEFVCDTIEDLHASNGRNIPLNQMVIFYRTNFQSRVFEDQLIIKRIPYKIIGGISFYLRREIKDILSFLRLLEQPNDVVAFLRVVNLPKRGFGEQFLAKLVACAQNRQLALLELIFQTSDVTTLGFSFSAKQREGFADFRAIMQNLLSIKATNSLPELVRAAIMQTKYLEVVDADAESKQEKRENLAELIVKAEEWEKAQNENEEKNDTALQENITDSKPSLLCKFLEEISLVSATDQLDADIQKVNLMTVHNGKGLEFEAVFLCGLEEELFPHINSKKTVEDIEEERRLFYVGLTRAKKLLHLSSASFRHLFGALRQMRQSRFLLEIPHELRQKATLPSKRHTSYLSENHFSKPKLQFKEFSLGQLVFHPDFGVGRIETIDESSLGQIYEVLFSKDNTSRKLVAQYAPLSLLEN